MIFTGTDKALLDRAARMLDQQAKATAWESITNLKTRRTAKLEFDRLARDARDLRALGKRIGSVAVKTEKVREQPLNGEPNGQQPSAG